MLFPDLPVAPTVPGIDLRCANVSDVLATVETGSVALVIADPPWDLYSQRPGVAAPDLSYSLLTPAQIGAHMAAATALLCPGGRFALWACWPLVVEVLDGRPLPPWLAVPSLTWRTGGAWIKGGPPGVGYHWRGHSEPVLVGTVAGSAGRALSMVRSGWESHPEEHSRKPAPWMASWVRAWVPPGGLVLDLYAGLGSVAEAVVLAGEGRRYIGAEIDRERYESALSRVHRAHMQEIHA